MKLISIVGARPQFIKLAPIQNAAKSQNIEHITINSGQHYDPEMSSELFQDLGLAPFDFQLNVGSGSHAIQTAAVMIGVEEVLTKIKPDWVLVYGDTNTTLGAAISSAKLNFNLAHLEAGLRNNNMSMPEEINRIVVDHISSFLFAPTETAVQNLVSEGISAEKIDNVGDVMFDICKQTMAKSNQKLNKIWDGDFVLATIHRAENTNSLERIKFLFSKLNTAKYRVVLPLHPRVRDLIATKLDTGLFPNLQIIEPLGYSEMIHALSKSRFLVTDSGGAQKEAFFLNKACITIRRETEWPETIAEGYNFLDYELTLIDGFSGELSLAAKIPVNPYGSGDTAEKVIARLLK